MRARLEGMLVFALLAAVGLAQEPSSGIGAGMTRKLAEVLGEVEVDREAGVGLEHLAAEIGTALDEVDPDVVADLNQQLADLKREERELLARSRDLSDGMPLIMGPLQLENVGLEDLSEATLELERSELLGQLAQIKKLERLEIERAQRSELERAARKVTPFSKALLATLEDIPKIQLGEDVDVESGKVDFPLRIAGALFETGDYIGALRQYRATPAEQMDFAARYRMARCLEESGRRDEAIAELKKIEADSAEKNAFWNSRATNLRQLIENSRSVRKVLARSQAGSR